MQSVEVAPLVGCHNLLQLTRMLQWETHSVFQHPAPKMKEKLLSMSSVHHQ